MDSLARGGKKRSQNWKTKKKKKKTRLSCARREGASTEGVCSLEFVVDALEKLVAFACGGGEGARHRLSEDPISRWKVVAQRLLLDLTEEDGSTTV